MNIEVLLVQFLVLAFTGVAWWLARRDLTARVAPPAAAPPADTQELEQLCATLEALVTDLAGRLEVMEQRLQAGVEAPLGVPSFASVPFPSPAPSPGSPPSPEDALSSAIALSMGAAPLWPVSPLPIKEDTANGAPASLPFSVPAQPPVIAEPENTSHATLYALLDEGITDPAEIARRTGLGRGEVDLILSLRARRAL